MAWIICFCVGAFIGGYVSHQTKRYFYYQGMKAGMRISDGVWRGEKLEYLSKRFDRYKRR